MKQRGLYFLTAATAHVLLATMIGFVIELWPGEEEVVEIHFQQGESSVELILPRQTEEIPREKAPLLSEKGNQARPSESTPRPRPVLDDGVKTKEFEAPERFKASLKYPRVAVKRKYEGDVIVEFTVREDGTCVHVSVVESSGYVTLDQRAVNTLKKYRFNTRERLKLTGERTIRWRIRFNLKFETDDK